MLSIYGKVNVDQFGRVFIDNIPLEEVVKHFEGDEVFMSVGPTDDSDEGVDFYADGEFKLNYKNGVEQKL